MSFFGRASSRPSAAVGRPSAGLLGLRQRNGPRDENVYVSNQQQSQPVSKQRAVVRTSPTDSENLAPSYTGLSLDKQLATGGGRSGTSSNTTQLLPAPSPGVLSDVTGAFANIDPPDALRDKLSAKASRNPSRKASKLVARGIGESPVVGADVSDPRSVAEYAADAYAILRRTEGRHLPKAAYMEQQPHINMEMRSILIDWLIDVCRKYKCSSQTLFLTTAFLDRYLEKRVTERKRLQLVGVAALLCAAKFEEQCPPRVKDLVRVADNIYSAEDVRDMEVAVLVALDFELVQPVALDFLPHFAEANGLTKEQRHLAQYALELALLRPLQLQYGPCRLAAAAVLLAAQFAGRASAWTGTAVGATQAEEADLEPVAQALRELLLAADAGGLRAAKKKFSEPKFSAVAKAAWVSGAEPSDDRSTTKSAALDELL